MTTTGPPVESRPTPFGNATSTPSRRLPRWVIPVAVVAGLLLLVVLPLVGSYNSLVAKDNKVDQSFADLDAQLQRRADLIPNLARAVQGALRQEQAVFGEIARARTLYGGARTVEEKAAANDQLTSALSRLLVVMEAYPNLKSIDTITNLQTQIEGTENRIAQQRRDYNAVVADYNLSIRRFPRSLIAGLFGFDKRPLFTASPGSQNAPPVDLNISTSPTPG